MEDNPIIFNGKDILLYPAESDPTTAEPLGKVVADSTQYSGYYDAPAMRDSFEPISFSVKVDKPELLLLVDHPEVQRCLARAKAMFDEIKEEIEMFYKLKPPRNRKERRERAKELKKKIFRFKTYCNEKGIEISYK